MIQAYNSEPLRFQSIQGLKQLNLEWGFDFMRMWAYCTDIAEDPDPPAFDVALQGGHPDERFFVRWPIDASCIEVTLYINGHSRCTITWEMWSQTLASVLKLKTILLGSVNRRTLEGFAQELAQELPQPLCAQLETIELRHIDPEAGFWDVLKGAAMARATGVRGRLSKIDLTVTGSGTWGTVEPSLLATAGMVIEVKPPQTKATRG